MKFTRVLLRQAPADYEEIGTLSVNQLGALLENAAGFAGVDSMPMHLAAALGKRGVALFGPTDEGTWGPWRSPLVVLRRDCVCLGAGIRTCSTGPMSRCMADLSAASTLEKLAEVLRVL
jgi:ADP-heptose:LPS heptosyltransferase